MDSILKILSFIGLTLSEDVNIEGQCVHILLNLTKVFHGSKAKADNYQILTMYPAGTQLANIIPAQAEAPRLFAIGNNNFNDTQLKCYADGDCTFSATGFDAVLLLIAVSWVLNIAFPPFSRLQLSFIAMAVLRKVGPKKGLIDVLKLSSFTKIQSKVGLTN